jgi:uncharacterized protein YgbK (DUF1537 family)
MIEPSDLGIVADDLTGACDVAACFTSRLGPIEVVLTPEDIANGNGVLRVTNTQSRLADPRAASKILCQVGTCLARKWVVFKKMDAGLRGPIGAELDGLLAGLRQSGADWSCVVAPAAPSIGRTTRAGVQCDHGIPIDQGALSMDLSSPPISSDIRAAIRGTGGGDYPVSDARNQEDLQRIVDARLGKGPVVFAGSIGLALALANRIRAALQTTVNRLAAHRPVVICGSHHPQSGCQIERSRKEGLRILDFDPSLQRFDMTTAPSGEEPILARILPNRREAHSVSPEETMRSFMAALHPLLEQIRPDSLGVIGGETAYHLMHQMQTRGLQVYARQAEIIAYTRMLGGRMDGCPMVCKGGSVGPEDAILQMLSILTTTARARNS